jgi:hypothetical protein
MRIESIRQLRSTRPRSGNAILEYAIVMTFLVPMFAGAFTIGMALSKAIQVSNVARDAVVLLVRSTTDPESGLDLSTTQNQQIIAQAGQGLGLTLSSQNNTGNAAVILSQVVMVGPNECSLGGMTPNTTAPFWGPGNCPNFGSYVFEYRVVMGNGARWSSTFGNPGGTLQPNGTVSAANIASNTSFQAPNFSSVTGMTLSASTFALVSEMYADVGYLNFFSVMKNSVIYARSIS